VIGDAVTAVLYSTLAFGVVSYVGLKVAAGQGRGVHGLLYAFALLFLLRYAFLLR